MNDNPYSPPSSRVADPAQSEVNATRPSAVTWASRMLLAGLAATLLNLALVTWHALPEQFAVPFLIGILSVFLVVAALTIWIILKIMAGRNWARIVLLIVDLISIPSLYSKIGAAFAMSLVVGISTTSIYVLDFLAAVLLFIGSSNAWFKKQKALRKSVA